MKLSTVDQAARTEHTKGAEQNLVKKMEWFFREPLRNLLFY